MKTLRLSVIIASVAIVFIGASAFAQKTEYPVAPAYVNPTPGEIPIIATYAFYQPEFYTKDKYLELKDAGFNMTRQKVEKDYMKRALEASEGTGIEFMLSSQAAISNLANHIAAYTGNPRIKMLMVGDEPKMSQFSSTNERKEILEKADPGKLTFTNILPSVSTKQLDAPDYYTYVSEFVKTVNPPFISFDCYPVKYNTNKDIYVYDKYYETLEVISKVAKESDRPFYSYILSIKHYDFPKPSRNFLRFQIFSALAYGAQGLPYFTYTQPDFDLGKNDFSNPPIDNNGRKTDVWYMVRDVNREVRNLQKVFLGAQVVDVSHTGVKLPSGTKRLRSLPSPFRSISSDGEGVVVSHLRNGNNEYIVLVNRDVLNKQKVRMEKTRPVTRLYGDGKEKTDRSSSVTLDPGGYAVYRL